MSIKLGILKKYGEGKTWFLESVYPLSYKLVILKCFHDHILTGDLNQTSFASETNKIYKYIQVLPTPCFKGKYFSIYQFDDLSGKPAVFFVDHSHNCFPLVFYSEPNKTDRKGFRLTALKKCLSLAYSDDVDHRFRAMLITCSNPS